MKHKNLQILQENGFLVPKFIVVKSESEIDLTFSNADIFAVRSSFSEEDNATRSFAGQFNTILNVKRNDIKTAVNNVIGSRNCINVNEYISALNGNKTGEMSVIIQEMINPDISGVVFTANPVGILNETVITVGYGLGSGVVEDKVSTTSYYYNNDDKTYICSNQSDSPLLSDDILLRLIEQSEKIKAIFGYEADVEFAIKDNQIYFLQVRPITTINKDNLIVLDNSNIVESYPGLTLPLTQDFVKIAYSGIFTNCISRITKDKKLVSDYKDCLNNMVDTANWRMYYQINNWYSILKLLPFSKKIIPIWQEMLGVNNLEILKIKDVKIKSFTKLTILKNFIKYLLTTPKEMNKLNLSFENRYCDYKAKIQTLNTVNDCIDLFYFMHDDVLVDWDITLINDVYTFLFTALAGKKNKSSLANIKNLASMKPILALNDLIDLYNQFGLESETYNYKEIEYIELYGDRCLGELKLETATYRTNPDLLRKQVINGVKAEIITTNEALRDNAFLKRAKLGIKNREISRMNRSRLYGLVRQLFLKIGEILYNKGQIEAITDVFYLYFNELSSSTDFKNIVKTRKEDEKIYKNIPSFGRLVYTNGIINHKICGKTNSLNNQSVLTGISTSMGIVEGEIVVIEQPDYNLDTQGKILVARSTDPGWVFLIRNASGIIAEKGSLLSHTAIISRELNKPALVNVKDCTKLLKTGDKVILNTFEGTVTKL